MALAIKRFGCQNISFTRGYFSKRIITNTVRPFSNQSKESINSTERDQGVRDDERVGQNPKDEEVIKDEILNAALNHVKARGWTVNAIAAGAEDIGLASSVSEIFKEFHLVKFFISKSNLEFEQHLSENELNVRDALEWRLKKVVPYADGYSEALALIAQPQNAPQSATLLLQLADSIAFHSLKDKSTDLNWYTKRGAIAALYASSEICLVQDKSEGYTETWKFLDRRAEELEKLKKQGFSITSLPVPELIHAGFTTIRNILGRNSPR